MVARHLLSSSSLSIERSSITRSTPLSVLFFFLRIRRPPSSPLFPYTPLSRSVLVSAALAGARPPATRLSLDDAVALALRENPTLRAKQHEYRATQAQEITAGLRPNPTA